MMAAFVQPPALISPAAIPSRIVMVWGDQVAMDAMRGSFGAKGWAWATALLGEHTKTPAIFLMPPSNVPDSQITRLINEVNAGNFGKLNAGYATVGAPQEQTGPTKR